MNFREYFYSIYLESTDIDQLYFNAIENEDENTLRKLVDQKAKENGYNIGPVYHGTDAKFNKFLIDFGEMTKSFNDWPAYYFFPEDLMDAALGAARWKSFMSKKNPIVISAYIKLHKPASTEMQRNENMDKNSAIQKGYDGKIHVNDHTKKITEYSVFFPTQIKSYELVTRDDNGEIIPLSKRFNPSSDDMRY